MQGYSPKELLEFIERSPTCFHVVNTLEGYCMPEDLKNFRRVIGGP